MSKNSGKSQNTSEPTDRVCRVSYLLNNDQPVRSTIIGDQPLFYMDFEELLEDELAALDMLEQELSLGNNLAPAYEYRYEELESCPEALILDFQLNISSVVGAGNAEERDISEILELLKTSRFAAALYEYACDYGIKIEFSDQVENADYLRESAAIKINSNLNKEEQVLLLARELRRVWQHKNGILLHPLTFYPDQAILVNRAQVADLTVCMIRTAWELQLGGMREAWERIENSPMADFARIFAREAFLDFRTLNNGMAMAAAFETWFISERCRVQDKYLIQQMLSDYQGYIFEAEDSSRTVTAELIARLGEVPFGKNYLAPYASTIIIDPLFTDVRDRANANFLWFIKFEKSFRETEQELQNGSGLHDHAFQHDLFGNQSKDSNNDKSENVIVLSYEDQDRNGRKEVACSSGGRGVGNAQVISFPRHAGKDD